MTPTREQLAALLEEVKRCIYHPQPAEEDNARKKLDHVIACLSAPPPEPQADLVALGERLRTQDNQMTAHPIFVVEHRSDRRRPWEFVTACLTHEGAQAYMKANGHNLREFNRIFVHSGYRNDEWIGLRNYLLSLPAAPPVTDTPQGMEADDDPAAWFPSPDLRCITCGHLRSVHLAKRGRCLSLNAVEGGSVPCACAAFVVDMVDALRVAAPKE